MSRKASSAYNKILETASLLFQKQGYYGTGLNEIIRQSGAPKGSLYYYFPGGKEQLAVAVIKMIGEEIHSIVEEIMNKYPSPREAILAIVRKASEIQNASPPYDLLPTITLFAIETANSNENLRIASKEVYYSLTKLYYSKLRDNGYDEKRAEYISTVVAVMLEGAICMSIVCQDGKKFSALEEMINDLID